MMQLLVAEQTERSAVVQLRQTDWQTVVEALPASEWSLSRRIASQIDPLSDAYRRLRLSTDELALVSTVAASTPDAATSPNASVETLSQDISIPSRANDMQFSWKQSAWTSVPSAAESFTLFINGELVMSVPAFLSGDTLTVDIPATKLAGLPEHRPWRTWSYAVVSSACGALVRGMIDMGA